MAIVDRRGVTVSATDPPIAGDPNPGLAIKAPVRVAATSSITLTGLSTVDGVALADGDRVLVAGQTDATTNGLYSASTGAWSRTVDANNNSQITQGTLVLVVQGTANANSLFELTSANPLTLGTSALAFAAQLIPTALAASLTLVAGTLSTVAMTGDVTSAAGSLATTIAAGAVSTTKLAAGAVTYAKMQNLTAARLLGNPTGGAAAPSEISLGATLAFSGTALQTAALTGDVTAAANSFATTIAAGAVSFAKMANLAANSVIGNNTGSPATPIALTQTQLTAMVNAFTASLAGAAPASGGGTANFLRADATWAAPPTGGTMVLLNTLTASNSATLSDTTSLTSTYSCYELIFTNVLPATNAVTLELQVHEGGAFPSTSYLGQFNINGTNTGSSTSFIQLSESTNVGNTGAGVSGRIRVANPSQASSPKDWYGEFAYLNGSSAYRNDLVAGRWNGGNNAVDGFQVLFSSGNIASGTIKVYGIS